MADRVGAGVGGGTIVTDYILSLIPFLAINVLLAASLNLLVGYSGLMSVSQGASMGIGAYGAAILATREHLPIALCIVIGAVIAGLVGLVFMALVTQLDTDDFILASFAFQMCVIAVFQQWTGMTGGELGMPNIPGPSLFGVTATSELGLAVVSVVVCGALSLFVLYLGKSRYALVLRAMRESERGAAALGKNVTAIKLSVFAVASAFAGVAGALYASVLGIITPENFDVTESILIIAFLLVGGIGNMWGVALGAAVLYLLPQIIQHFGLVSAQYIGPVQQIIYGAIIALFVFFRPAGLLPERPLLRAGDRTRASFGAWFAFGRGTGRS
jgi:branched-chain amino acid transport system permease protein